MHPAHKLSLNHGAILDQRYSCLRNLSYFQLRRLFLCRPLDTMLARACHGARGRKCRTEPRINPGGSGHGGKGNGSVNGFGEGGSVQARGKIGHREGPRTGQGN